MAWTRAMLDGWREQGRSDEVKRALKDARASRLWGAWKRLGARSGATFGRVVLLVLYFTVLLPFALLARAGRERGGWRAPRPSPARAGDPLAAARAQF